MKSSRQITENNFVKKNDICDPEKFEEHVDLHPMQGQTRKSFTHSHRSHATYKYP
jgi:hypothetical protein